MYELLSEVRHRLGVTALHITHSRKEATHLADLLFVLQDGRVRHIDSLPRKSERSAARGQLSEMIVQVTYTTQLKAALGRGSEKIDLPQPTTLGGLLDHLGRVHGPAFRNLVLDSHDQLLPSILLCVGDQQVQADAGWQLQEGDEVTILSAISGG